MDYNFELHGLRRRDCELKKFFLQIFGLGIIFLVLEIVIGYIFWEKKDKKKQEKLILQK